MPTLALMAAIPASPPKLQLVAPPGGASTRDEGRSVMKLLHVFRRGVGGKLVASRGVAAMVLRLLPWLVHASRGLVSRSPHVLSLVPHVVVVVDADSPLRGMLRAVGHRPGHAMSHLAVEFSHQRAASPRRRLAAAVSAGVREP